MTPALTRETIRFRTQAELDAHVRSLQDQMKAAAANLDFEKAASIRDEIARVREQEIGLPRLVRKG